MLKKFQNMKTRFETYKSEKLYLMVWLNWCLKSGISKCSNEKLEKQTDKSIHVTPVFCVN